MAVFNVGNSIRPVGGSGGGVSYGIATDQLDILEAQLGKADNKLSPGDYKLLIEKAQQLYATANSESHRSDVLKKIEVYKAEAQGSTLKDQQSLKTLDNNVLDDAYKNSIGYGNDPLLFLTAQAQSLQAKTQQLAKSINDLSAAGDDPSAHILNYNDSINQLQDTLHALEAVQTGTPTNDYAAYIKTNNQGEITDVKVKPNSSETGYNEVSGASWGGLKVYGASMKQGDSTIFKLGNNTFASSNSGLSVDASGNIVQQQSVLTNPNVSKYDISPETVRTQSTIRSGDYAKDASGVYYKNNGDGSYTKYINADPQKLGIDENSVLSIPNNLRDGILPNVSTTSDMSQQPEFLGPPGALDFGTAAPPASVMPDQNAGVTTPPQGTTQSVQSLRPPAGPQSNSPNTNKNLASRTIDSAKGFLARIFQG